MHNRPEITGSMIAESITEELTGNVPFKKTFLFAPSDGKDMKVEYPELGSVAEFNMLNNAEMIFVWLIANKTSHLSEDNEKDRTYAITSALEISKLKERLDTATYYAYLEGNFTQKVDSAYKKMRSFMPSVRMKAKLMLEKTFNNLSRMVDISEEEFKFMSSDDKKKYADFAKTVTGVMDDMIPALETAYGVKEVKRRKGEAKVASQATLMDIVMREST